MDGDPEKSDGNKPGEEGAHVPENSDGVKQGESEQPKDEKPKPELYETRYTRKYKDENNEIIKVEERSVGRVKFLDQVQNLEKTADIAIVSDDSHPKLICDIFLSDFSLSPPNLVISVTGSSKGLAITGEQFTRIKQGLEKAVTATDCWVLTGGTSVGVDGLVSESLRDSQLLLWIGTLKSHFCLIGIANWNCVEDNEKISAHLKESEKPYTYFVKQRKKEARNLKRVMNPLNPLYTHFAMIESGVRGKIGPAIKMRAATEAYIARIPGKCTDEVTGEPLGGLNIPTVIVVLGGEVGIIPKVATSLTDGIPVVICQGTGGASDVIAKCVNGCTNKTVDIEKVLESIFEEGFGKIYTRETVNQHVESLKRCVEKSYNVTVFRLDRSASATMDLDDCILKALLNNQTRGGRDPVETALCWNRCDPIVKDILLASGDINSRPGINMLMTQAILEDKTEFVKLFLDCGMEMFSFLTPHKLMELYEDTAFDHAPFMKLLKKSTKSKTEYTLDDVYRIPYLFTSAKPQFKLITAEGKTGFRDPFRELFLWSVFSNRMEASEFFWMHSKNPLLLALIGSKLWRAHSNALSVEENALEDEMEENEAKYKEMAQSMLDMCWETNQSLSGKMLEREHRSFGNKSLMDVAGFIESKDFIAHPCTQVTIENLWKGGLRCKYSQILSSLFVPFFISNLKLNESHKTGASVSWEDDSNPKPFHLIEDRKESVSARKVSVVNESDQLAEEEKMTFKFKAQLYYNAPVTKFVSHTMAYIVFVGVFTQFYLFDNKEGERSHWEYLNFLFTCSYMTEEMRQLITEDATLGMKLLIWGQSEWNWVDLSYLSLGMLAFFLKPYEFSIAKGVYGIVLMLMWIRLLRFYQCSSKLGPMWIMIRKMIVETLVFMMVFSVILIGFGITTRCIMETFGQDDGYTEGMWIFLKPFFMFNGELFLDGFMDNDKAWFYLSKYVTLQLFFGNALMLNLLVALYAQVFSEVLEVSDVEWKNEMFQLMKEYQDKTYLPPPLSLFESFYAIISFCCCSGADDDESDETKQLRIFETYCLSKVMTAKASEKSTEDLILEIDHDIQLQNDRLRETKQTLDAIRRAIIQRNEAKEERRKRRLGIQDRPLTLWSKDQKAKEDLKKEEEATQPVTPLVDPVTPVLDEEEEDEDGLVVEEEECDDSSRNMMLFSERKPPQ